MATLPQHYQQIEACIRGIIQEHTGYAPRVYAAMQAASLKWKVIVNFQGVNYELELDSDLNNVDELKSLLTQLRLSY